VQNGARNRLATARPFAFVFAPIMVRAILEILRAGGLDGEQHQGTERSGAG
jgi:hypothetical protein